MTHQSKTLPNISRDLAYVLFCTANLNSLREVDFELSSTSLLIGFITARTPWGTWLMKYFEAKQINVDAMMRSRNLDQTMMMRVGDLSWEPREKPWVMSKYMSYLIDDAEKFLASISTDKELSERHLLAAYIYSSDTTHTSQLAVWGIQRIDWSNSFISEIALRHPEELEKWATVHRDKFGDGPELPHEEAKEQQASASASDKPPSDKIPFIQDQTLIHIDGPAKEDRLGRKYLAETLAIRMNTTWLRYRDEDLKGSFMLHIHGAWGSGKSSLLNFLRVELQPGAQPRAEKQVTVDATSLDWIVVDFNAWQRQHVEPPWWALIDTVYTQALTQLQKIYKDPVRAWKLRFKERWWRLTTGRRDHLIAFSISFLILVGVAAWWLRSAQGDLSLLQSVLTILGVVGTLWSTVLLISRSLISGSSQSAQAFMQRSGDPMERVSLHFVDLIKWIDKPVAIFVDDLDRCQTRYVVTLLEGIQTLFNNRRVVYVIAADRRWLHVSFETIYDHFVTAVKEPGRHLGSLFLEKAFEASVSVPRMSPERRRIYMDYLGSGEESKVAEIASLAAESKNEFAADKTEADVLERLSTGTGDPLRDEIRKGAALRQLARQDVAKSTEYFLKPFDSLAEPNARAMKRFVNAYTLLRDLAVLGGSNVLFDLNTRRQLALWAIVSLRWPLLKERLEQHLQEYPDDDVITLICEEVPVPIHDPEIQQLLRSPEVIKVFRGGDIGTRLDKETICSLVGISSAQPRSGGVA
jgi:hypothetical protein